MKLFWFGLVSFAILFYSSLAVLLRSVKSVDVTRHTGVFYCITVTEH